MNKLIEEQKFCFDQSDIIKACCCVWNVLAKWQSGLAVLIQGNLNNTKGSYFAINLIGVFSLRGKEKFHDLRSYKGTTFETVSDLPCMLSAFYLGSTLKKGKCCL